MTSGTKTEEAKAKTNNDGKYSSEEILHYLESVVERENDIIRRMYAVEMVARHKIDGRYDMDVATVIVDCLSHLRVDANTMVVDTLDIIKHNNLSETEEKHD